jgi:peptide/nickel transport system substrate-binding protein
MPGLNFKKISGLILALLLTVLLAGCFEDDTPAVTSIPPTAPDTAVPQTGQPLVPTVAPNNTATPSNFPYKPDKTFIFGLAQEPVAFNDQVGLDPANLTDHSSLLIVRQLYETLFQFKPGLMGTQQAAFVRSVTVSPDELSYAIKLMRGIRFSDGSVLDANAVKFNFDRWAYAGVYHKGDFQTWRTYFGGFPGDVIDSVEASPDGISVMIKLKRKMASLPQILAMPQFGLVSPASFDQNGYFARPIGSGPYMAEKPVRGEVHYVVLKPNPNYTMERPDTIKPPLIGTVVAMVLRPGQDGLTEIKRGTISATDKIRPEDMPAAHDDPALSFAYRDPLNIAFLSLNQSRPPFSQREVRQAFAYAINVRGLNDKLYNGLGQPASYFLPPATYGAASTDPYPYDPDRARQLLALAGYPGGLGFPNLDLWVLPVPRIYYPDPAKIAQAIKSDLANIGITVNVRSDEEWPAYRENRDQGKLTFFMNGWQGSNGDPDEFFGNFFGQTRAEDGYENLALQDIIKQGRETLDLVTRRQLYRQAQEIIYNDYAVIPLSYVQSPVALRPDIAGYVAHPSGIENWAVVSFAQK